MTAAAGTLLDRYEILGKLGEGGYGTVYEARDRVSSERVALKELKDVNVAAVTRFKQEFRAVQEVHHPNLVRLDALFEDRGKWVIAMELVLGIDLLNHLYAGDNERGFHEPALRDAFCQLAQGLCALHAGGFVHRDLKPSNVRVTPEGRVVLLDFGLTTALDPKQRVGHDRRRGTLAYMAPEQLGSGGSVGAGVDWYAFGVCLYEALTGVLPIDAPTPAAMVATKMSTPAPAASTQAVDVPADLDQLCTALLSIAPEARPSGREVHKLLSHRARVYVPSLFPANDNTISFTGRELELRSLDRALRTVQSGARQIVLIEGDSGIGKSALVEHFLFGDAAHDALVLRARCYENEMLGYKAFDGAIDGLVHFLDKLDRIEAAQVLPPRAALLGRLFPALGAVKALGQNSLSGVAADPGVQRMEAFALFARLLANVSRHKPIVLAMEDLQWADAESFRLLLSLLSGADELRLLVLATLRPHAELAPEVARNVASLRDKGSASAIKLEGLPRVQAQKLARELMGPLIPDSWLEVIVKESAGHPLFLTVLARFAESHDPKTAAELTLDAAIAARVGSLPSKARHLLETAAVVGVPTVAHVCGRAAGLAPAELARVTTELCNQKLLRRRRAGEIACFHDRIRNVVHALLPPAQRQRVHAALATALAEQGEIDSSELARHYQAAGELRMAFDAYRRGAEQAMTTLAFVRAAGLYARALELGETLQLGAAQAVELCSARAHALACAGLSEQAARQYLRAADHAQGEARTRLRILATQHLLQSGLVEEGMGAARALLAELDLPLPKTMRATIARLLWDRVWLGVSGLEVELRPQPISERARMQLDALSGLATPVGWLEPLTSAVMNTKYLRLARALGEPQHVARAIAEEAFARTLRNALDPRIDELLQQARSLAGPKPAAVLDVNLALREANVALFRWQLTAARQHLEHAQRVGTERCPDQPWLLTNVRTALSAVLASGGEHAQLRACTAAWMAEARDRQDSFALAMLEGMGLANMCHLMQDDPERARASLAEALGPWPREPFSFAHYGEFVASMYRELYVGGSAARRWLADAAPRLSQAWVLRYGLGQQFYATFQCAAALAAYAEASPSARPPLLREAIGHAEGLRASGTRYGLLSGKSHLVQCLALEGKGDQALALLRSIGMDEQSENFMFTSMLRYLQGVLVGGEAGEAARRDVLSGFADQGWRNPRRAIVMLCPAVPAMELA